MNRPSHKELTGKLKETRSLAAEGRISILEPFSFACDAIELGYEINEISETIVSLLDEITPDYYAGSRPPQRSYEDFIKGADLFAFEWQSRLLKADIYFKFAIRERQLWLVSLHKSRRAHGGKS